MFVNKKYYTTIVNKLQWISKINLKNLYINKITYCENDEYLEITGFYVKNVILFVKERKEK